MWGGCCGSDDADVTDAKSMLSGGGPTIFIPSPSLPLPPIAIGVVAECTDPSAGPSGVAVAVAIVADVGVVAPPPPPAAAAAPPPSPPADAATPSLLPAGGGTNTCCSFLHCPRCTVFQSFF